MPFVNIMVTREGTRPGATSVTEEEKARLISGVSKLLLDVLNKPLDSTFVVIQEIETSSWGRSGIPVTEFRRQAAEAEQKSD